MSGVYLAITKIISVIFAAIFMPLSGLTYGIDSFSISDRTDDSRTNVVGIGAYFRSQGVTSDNESLYFSSKTTLIKTEKDARTLVNANYSAIPDELSENYGIKHIGGISYYNGKIYAGMEDSKVWNYPIVGVFDASTLQLSDFYILDKNTVQRGLPWVAVNSDDGYLYCMNHSKTPDKILVYDISNEMSFVKEIMLSESVPSVQGAEFYNGCLYAATNNGTQAIYKIDVQNGNVEKYIDRNLTSGSEGEGMTFMEKNGETVLVAMDMGPIFVNAFVRQYKIK